MDLKLYRKTLTDIYLVSNTPAYLFETLRKSNIIKEDLSKRDTQGLLKEFEFRVNSPITNVSEIAELYAILVALTYKDGAEVKGFFNSIAEKIKFEWFSKIAEYYLSKSNQSSSELITIEVNPPSKIENTNQQIFKVVSS